MTDPRPLPSIDAESAPFWAAAREHRLVAQQCASCGTVFHYPRALCPACHSDRLEWRELSGRGSIHTFTVSRRAASPAFAGAVPYVVALIDLDEGPRMMSNIRGADPAEVAIGLRVRVAFEDVTDEVSLPVFELDPGEESP